MYRGFVWNPGGFPFWRPRFQTSSATMWAGWVPQNGMPVNTTNPTSPGSGKQKSPPFPEIWLGPDDGKTVMDVSKSPLWKWLVITPHIKKKITGNMGFNPIKSPGFLVFCHHRPMVFLCFSYVLPMFFLWSSPCSYGFPMGSRSFFPIRAQDLNGFQSVSTFHSRSAGSTSVLDPKLPKGHMAMDQYL